MKSVIAKQQLSRGIARRTYLPPLRRFCRSGGFKFVAVMDSSLRWNDNRNEELDLLSFQRKLESITYIIIKISCGVCRENFCGFLVGLCW